VTMLEEEKLGILESKKESRQSFKIFSEKLCSIRGETARMEQQTVELDA
jgi:hypothetical protein